MVRSARRRITSLGPSMTALTLLLAAGLALAQQAGTQSGPVSSAPNPVKSVAEAYRKGTEFQQKKDYVEAMRWFHKAADKGDENAINALKALGVQ